MTAGSGWYQLAFPPMDGPFFTCPEGMLGSARCVLQHVGQRKLRRSPARRLIEAGLKRLREPHEAAAKWRKGCKMTDDFKIEDAVAMCSPISACCVDRFIAEARR